MDCPKCNAPIQENAHFCEECGFNISSSPLKKTNRFEFSADPCLAISSDIGKRHKTNQDAGIVGRGRDGIAVLVVADGVSTSFCAELASTLSVRAAYDELIKFSPINNAKDCMLAAIESANLAALNVPGARQTSCGSEATIVAAIVQDSTVTIGWVGDSRAYIIGNETSRLITTDDSWLTAMLQIGKTYEEAIQDPRAHIILQCLGMQDAAPEIHITEVELNDDEALLLCTDGMWNYYNDPKIINNTIDSFESPRNTLDICNYLVELSNAAGGHDNITVAIYMNN